MNHLTEKRKMKRNISALLITAETIMVFLVPLGLTIWLVVNKLQDINLAPQTFIEPIQQVAEFIKKKRPVMMYWEKIRYHSSYLSSLVSDR